MSLHQTGGRGTIRSPRLDLQLKCKASAAPTEDTFGHSLKLKNYDDLRDWDRSLKEGRLRSFEEGHSFLRFLQGASPKLSCSLSPSFEAPLVAVLQQAYVGSIESIHCSSRGVGPSPVVECEARTSFERFQTRARACRFERAFRFPTQDSQTYL